MDAPSRDAFLTSFRAEVDQIPLPFSNSHPLAESQHFLSANKPRPLFRLPAQPWTTVTTDDQLVSYLISLFLTWDHMYMSLLDRDRFVEAMARGKLDTPYCSPMLVNAILAYSCVDIPPILDVQLQCLAHFKLTNSPNRLHTTPLTQLISLETGSLPLPRSCGMLNTVMQA